ncbi:hypothetical protein EDF81_1602 [Enterobacter sp. BIGb0383]|uniref:DUF6896 domain-containing protein n=1 Tax=unclassified Enterobacter TaxID=2608935 RepID=UPI000F48CBD4|nr:MULTISPECIES: hypothetical protein [unclassified Enterobacter]ROP63081.1 hypothetical protein EDF81_1602 [Enterobacter sp. BIGb0383]ROS13242.1 hypothetical protein EC848_1604 [Enterobacter sp. BIGb0359]
MNELTFLINDYQKSVYAAVITMYRSGILMPSSRYDWINADIPFYGELEDGSKYYKHGAGCLVVFEIGDIDFDFGEQGEFGGFNSWWLTRFAGDNLPNYGFSDIHEVAECLKEAYEAGQLNHLGNDLYYVSTTPLKYASDVYFRHEGDILPGRNHDHVFVLQSHYFQAAELMLKNHQKLNDKWQRNDRLNQREMIDNGIYLSTWLGFLAVTCEGFRKLNMRILLQIERPEEFKELVSISDKVGRLMKQHADALRKFRNDVFHLRESQEVIRGFFDRDSIRLDWAHELHVALRDFFSAYRIKCEVYYIMHDRKGESCFGKK